MWECGVCLSEDKEPIDGGGDQAPETENDIKLCNILYHPKKYIIPPPKIYYTTPKNILYHRPKKYHLHKQ